MTEKTPQAHALGLSARFKPVFLIMRLQNQSLLPGNNYGGKVSDVSERRLGALMDTSR